MEKFCFLPAGSHGVSERGRGEIVMLRYAEKNYRQPIKKTPTNTERT